MVDLRIVATTEALLAVIKLATVIAGFFIVWLGARAYRNERNPTVLWLTIGMAVLTLGAISEGAAFQGLGWTIGQSHIFEAVVTLFGFGVLVYSLYAK